MKKILILSILFAVLGNVCAAKKSVSLEMKKAEKALRSFLEERNIKADFVYSERDPNILYVKCKTKMYMTRRLGKGGKEYGKYFQQEGPKADGFLLRVVSESAMAKHQAMMLQTRTHAHWKSFSFINRFNNKKQFFNNFAFGEKSPVSKDIIHVLGDLDKPLDNMRLYIANVNYHNEDLDIQVKLDGKPLVNRIFKPREPFQTIYFPYKIPLGKHKLEISSSKIAKKVIREFKLDEKITFFIHCWDGKRFGVQMKKYSFDKNKQGEK